MWFLWRECARSPGCTIHGEGCRDGSRIRGAGMIFFGDRERFPDRGLQPEFARTVCAGEQVEEALEDPCRRDAPCFDGVMGARDWRAAPWPGGVCGWGRGKAPDRVGFGHGSRLGLYLTSVCIRCFLYSSRRPKSGGPRAETIQDSGAPIRCQSAHFNRTAAVVPRCTAFVAA